MKKERITIIIADDHPLVRNGLKEMLKSEKHLRVVAEAANGAELLEKVKCMKPNIVITDIKMPGMDGIEAVKRMKARMPSTGIIVISMFNKEQYILEMACAGVLGYLLKGADKAEILAAINTVAKNEYYFNSCFTRSYLKRLASSGFNSYNGKPSINVLSEREKIIIRKICDGNNSEQIATQMNYTPRTVETYRQKILDKLELPNSSSLAIYAVKTGIYNVED